MPFTAMSLLAASARNTKRRICHLQLGLRGFKPSAIFVCERLDLVLTHVESEAVAVGILAAYLRCVSPLGNFSTEVIFTWNLASGVPLTLGI